MKINIEYELIPFIETCLDGSEGNSDYVCPLHPDEILFTITADTKWNSLGECCAGRGDSIFGIQGCKGRASGGWHEIIRKEYCQTGAHHLVFVFGSYGG